MERGMEMVNFEREFIWRWMCLIFLGDLSTLHLGGNDESIYGTLFSLSLVICLLFLFAFFFAGVPYVPVNGRFEVC